ncbi:N-acetyl-1-D-myo-inositol-2-amino-2-deoxy-alpha-D-glucopyranoside deacetylase [Mycolicibacterium sp. 120266]|uniref:N-acetyl-1-D-myo-inositol-2-amino-2-deoxy-alpha- D-glucopyranoside deacetylase n=1 Tax=Mycolicibacterium sp. 120266 TaxID=3090601 RepID=UPI00299E1120|nr:N-acetyl-1-D-myo-inositol-2-amino-2-deoxy-alpha-D-glucopyranoside deacetylase [Mycolicibacterium sp. 120266]MDX1875357.1 N-acetyl-1-D-myo-inositol-2-amino-2-deoxy-alpha-D-glucopyranoside deacetylase [Mycolicibacterium sp. 120266]
MQTPRLLFVHAHPDDESLTTGATIAHYAAQGATVRVVTCTMGEEGEVIGDRWSQLAVDAADQLGGYRISELSTALAALGAGEPIFLGGAGRWRDSGMAGTPARHRQRFVDADIEGPVAALVAIIRELRPHVVVTYDPNGGYGHPDHIRAHEVTTAAVAAAAGDGHPGEPWQVPKFYWTVLAQSAIADGLAAIGEPPADWITIKPEDLTFGYPDEKVDAVIDASAQLPAKAAALRAHATQVSVAPDGRSLALSNLVALPLWGIEHYVLAAGSPGERDGNGVETDLLAGVNLG